MKNKKRKKKVNVNKFILSLSLVLMLVIGICALLNSNVFIVKSIEVRGNNEISKEDIIKEGKIAKNKNIFTYNIKEIKKHIEKNSYIEYADVKIKIPNKVTVEVKEKENIAIIKHNNDLCYIDNEGTFLEKFKEIKKNNDKIIVDVDYTITKEDKIDFKDEETKKRLLYLLSSLKKDNLYKKIRNINLKEDSNIIMTTKDNIKILLSNKDDLDYNISRVDKILVDLQSKKTKNGTINLTYGNYAIYNPK